MRARDSDRRARMTNDITMVKVHCVVKTAQVHTSFIIVCEGIMELQPSKKMNLMNES